MINSLRDKKAITLIALVITIVVLIILASVSIALILGEDGIISKARLSRIMARKAQAEEELIIQIHNIQIEKEGDVSLADILEVFKDENKTDITVTEILGEPTAMLSDSIIEVPENNPEEITVILEDYEEFSFTIGTGCTITKVCGIDYDDYAGETLDTAEASTKITIAATPSSQTSNNQFKQNVSLLITSSKGWQEWSGRVAWTTSKTTKPTAVEWSSLTLNDKNDKEKTANTEKTTNSAGEYYLWIEINTCGKTKTQCFGPYQLSKTPTNEDIIFTLGNITDNQTKGKIQIGTEDIFEGWTLKYLLNSDNDNDAVEVEQGTTTLVNIVRGDRIDIIFTNGDQEITDSKTITELKKGFSLAYSATGASNIPSGTTQYALSDSYEFTISSTIPTKSGFIFSGWNTKSDGSGTTKAGGQTLETSESLNTLYAQWVAQSIESFSTVGETSYSIPYSGTYKLEVWGAQGGSYSNTYYGGYGGYSVGQIYLTKNTKVYVNVGGQGTCQAGNSAINGGYNGGGKGHAYTDSSQHASGGGATHIALDSGLLNNFSSSLNRLLIVAGGGGGSAYFYASSTAYYYGIGGSGGGYLGKSATVTQKNYTYSRLAAGGAQELTTNSGVSKWDNGGKNTTYSTAKSGAFGKSTETGTDAFVSGGGGGFYGGGSAFFGAGGGGSGYIGNSNLTNKHMAGYYVEENSNTSKKTNKITSANTTASSDVAKKGNGYARITLISVDY